MLNYFVKKINNKKGFTLVELVVVIAILGILAAIAVPRFTASRVEAQEAADKATVRTLNSAVSMYLASDKDKNALTDAKTAKAAVDVLSGAEFVNSMDTVRNTITWDGSEFTYTPASP